MNIGDKVRFLFETGGGIVKGFQGKDIVLVEDENGFSIPMLIRECVVIDTNEYNFEKKTVAPKREEQKKPTKNTVASLRHDDEDEDFPEDFDGAEEDFPEDFDDSEVDDED